MFCGKVRKLWKELEKGNEKSLEDKRYVELRGIKERAEETENSMIVVFIDFYQFLIMRVDYGNLMWNQ